MSALDDDLLPCPHCGSPAKSYHRPDATGWQNTDWICCDSDDDGVEPNCGAQTCLHSSREAAVAAWNRRTSSGYTIVRKEEVRDEDYDDEGKAALSALEATPPAPKVTEAQAEVVAKLITRWLGRSWEGLPEGRVTEKGFPVFSHSQRGWGFNGRKGDMIDLAHEALSAAQEAGKP